MEEDRPVRTFSRVRPRIFDNRIESSQFRESFSRLKDFMAKLLRVNGGCLGAERR